MRMRDVASLILRKNQETEYEGYEILQQKGLTNLSDWQTQTKILELSGIFEEMKRRMASSDWKDRMEISNLYGLIERFRDNPHKYIHYIGWRIGQKSQKDKENENPGMNSGIVWC